MDKDKRGLIYDFPTVLAAFSADDFSVTNCAKTAF